MIKTNQDFAVFMDTTKMKALFQQELPDCLSGNWKLTDCQIQHPRYKAYLNPKSRNKSFLAVAYHLEGINEQTQEADNRILYVKAYLGQRSQTEYLKVCADPCQQGAVLHIDKLSMIGWFFPGDPALPWLSKVLDKEFIRNYFTDFLLFQYDLPYIAIREITLSIINYRPEIRCTYRYDIERLAGVTQTLYGKTFADGSGAEVHRRIVDLYQRMDNRPENFVMPWLLGYDYILHTLWMDGLDGVPLLDIVNEQNADRLMARLARHLVDFHSVTIDGLETISAEEQLAEIEKNARNYKTLFRAYPSALKQF